MRNMLDSMAAVANQGGPIWQALGLAIMGVRNTFFRERSSPTFFEGLVPMAERMIRIAQAAGMAAKAIASIDISMWVKFIQVLNKILPVLLKIGNVIRGLMAMSPLGLLARGINYVLGPPPAAAPTATAGVGGGGALQVTTNPTINLVVKVFDKEIKAEIISRSVDATREAFNLGKS